ncbi:MAG: hypothetical protein QXW91_03230, partial [Candidatus Nitrosotenuis sp.]
ISRTVLYVLPVFIIIFILPNAFAQSESANIDSDFTIVVGDQLKENPMAIQILKNIEIAKQRLAEMQDKQNQLTEHQKFIEEQRRIAKEQLEKDLASLNKNNESFTPRNSFSTFLSGINATHHEFYWNQFDYMNERIKVATEVRQQILRNGGSFAEAQAEFLRYASMPRSEMISLVSSLNIKHGFSDSEMQQYFDSNGKLPRFDDGTLICYACEKYDAIKEEMLLAHEKARNQPADILSSN